MITESRMPVSETSRPDTRAEGERTALAHTTIYIGSE
jgi:hypothetical protein